MTELTSLFINNKMIELLMLAEFLGSIDKAGHSGRWGRLKSGRGWICLEHAEKVA